MSKRAFLFGLAGVASLIALGACEQAIGFDGYTFDRAAREAWGQPVWPLDSVPASCPEAKGGPALVPVRGGYCIDATEVTREQYQAKLGEMATLSRLPQCSWKTDYTPSCNWPPDSPANLPVSCVDWCDAYAFCTVAGKRLCGRIGAASGATTPDAESHEPRVSQWFNACSSGGVHDLPYGDVFDSPTCATGTTGVQVVAGLPSCGSTVPGYGGVYDLSGNVGEWEDSCSGDTGENDGCKVRGGGWRSDAWHAQCDSMQSPIRSQRLDSIGFRCCAP